MTLGDQGWPLARRNAILSSTVALSLFLAVNLVHFARRDERLQFYPSGYAPYVPAALGQGTELPALAVSEPTYVMGRESKLYQASAPTLYPYSDQASAPALYPYSELAYRAGIPQQPVQVHSMIRLAPHVT